MGVRREVCKVCNTSKIVTTSPGVGASTRVDHGSRSEKRTTDVMWGYVTGSSRSDSSKRTGEGERPVSGDCFTEGRELVEDHTPLLCLWETGPASWDGETVTSTCNGAILLLYDIAG